MRQIVLDTETTGLEPEEGHRVIEIGCVELIDRRLTGNRFHEYLDPEREIDREAIEVHGIDNAFLADKPRFTDIAENFLRFIQGSEVVIHNAPFDVGFINAELKRLGPQLGRMEDHASILDTLVLAKRMHPGQRNSLDALCKRYQIDNRHRDLHGALLDAEILASVYLAMTGGQTTLGLEGDSASQFSEAGAGKPQLAPRKIDRRNHAALKVVSCPPEDLAAHRERLEAIDKASGGNCLWHKP